MKGSYKRHSLYLRRLVYLCCALVLSTVGLTGLAPRANAATSPINPSKVIGHDFEFGSYDLSIEPNFYLSYDSISGNVGHVFAEYYIPSGYPATGMSAYLNVPINIVSGVGSSLQKIALWEYKGGDIPSLVSPDSAWPTTSVLGGNADYELVALDTNVVAGQNARFDVTSIVRSHAGGYARFLLTGNDSVTGGSPAADSFIVTGTPYIKDEPAPNTAPTFVNAITTIDTYPSVGTVPLTYLLPVSDTDIGQTLTWTTVTAPSHGTLVLTGATAWSGGTFITPGYSTSYTPTTGYIGTDSFTVQVSDGIVTVPRTFQVNVIDDQTPPIITSLSSQAVSTSSAKLSVTSNESGMFYFVVTTSAQNPTASNVVSGSVSNKTVNGSYGSTANTPTNIPLSTLSSTQQYYAYVVAKDGNGNLSAVSSVLVRAVGVPTVVNKAVTEISANGATLNGAVADNGYRTTVSFQYGKTTSYGSTASASVGTVAAGSGLTDTTAVLSGLTSNTTYHYRLEAVNAAGTTYGTDQTFTTPAAGMSDADAVAAAKSALVVGYTGNDTAASVTQNVTLSTTGANGTNITWASSDGNLIAGNGAVTRPSYTEGDKTVTLTATISKGTASDTQLFTLTVLKQGLTDEEAVAAARDALNIGYASGDDASSVTQNVTLDTAGINGTSILWITTNLGVIGMDGRVTRPSYQSGDETVELTALITKGSAGLTKTFYLTVTKLAQTDTEAVAAAKDAVEVGYASGDTAAGVTQDVMLSTTGTDGTTVTWSSDKPGVIAVDGTVTRPGYTVSDAVVTLTATIKKGTEQATRTFTLTVAKLAQTDAEAVAAAKSALEVGYASGDSVSSVTQDVTLSTTGLDGTSVAWSSDTASAIAYNGTVTRPSYTTGDATVTLTATITKGSATATKTFTLTVTKLLQTDAEAVAAAKLAVEVGYAGADTATSVTQNVTLSTTGTDGTTVTWSSDKPSVIAANGTVTRPSYTTGDATVTLTATITKGSATATKTFTLTVTKLSQTDAEAVTVAKPAVEVGYAGADTATSVTQNVTLSTTGTDGTTVTWNSDKASVIAVNGTVARPSYTTGDATVTLIATITKGSATATKTFTLTVTKLAQTDAEAVAAAKPAVEVGYANGEIAASVMQDVTLSTTGTDGTTVTWSSDKPSVIAANGTITRPSYTTGDATVTLTATITKGSATATKTFMLTVKKLAQTDAEAVAASKPAVEVGYAGADTATSVTQNVTLITTGTDGTTVTWSSDKASVIATDGTVTRPSYTTGDATVTLTATITRGSATATKTFTLTVTKLLQTDAEAVAAAKPAVEVGYAGADTATSVTQNVTLSTTGTDGTTVTWSSDKPSVIAANGTVTRPSFTTGDATVTLTATIKKGTETATKTFVLTVIKLAQTDAEAVAAAKPAVEVGYAGANTATNVTQNVTLSTTGTDGTSIAWSSDTTSAIANNGTVTRPGYTAGDVTVTLTATITKGSATATKTFTLTVTKLPQTDAEAVAAAKPAVEVGYANGETDASVTQNVTLSTGGSDGTTVTWSSDKASVIAADGTVTRPSYTTGDATVTLTATITKGSATATKTFTLTVTKLAQTDAEAVAAAKPAVEVGYAGSDTATSVTQNVTLSTTGTDGTTVTWSSDKPSVIAANGTVTRPSYTTGDATVTLTATITRGSATATKTFTLTVKKLAQTDAEAVAAAKPAVEIGYANSDLVSNVTQNVTLSTTGTDGTTVTWSSDKPSVIAANGTVTRPSYTTGGATVTLTATITKGSATATKTFTLTVTKLAQTDAESVAAAKPAVEVGYAGSDTATSVTQNVTLSTTGTDGTMVTWSSDKPSVIAANGTVTRPSYTTGDATVTLTATITKGSATATKTFTLTVTKLAQTDAEAVAIAEPAVEVGYTGSDTATNVTQNVTLSTTGTDGTTVTWSSDKPSVIAVNGTVERPSYTTGDATVTLTATITKGSATATKTFTLTVTKLAQTDAEAVAIAKPEVEVGYAGSDTATNVTQNITLSTIGIDGTTITWSSDKASVITANGAVTRPSYTTGDATVTLTATITKGSATAKKTFTLTVTKLAQTDAEAVAAAKPAVEVGYAGADTASNVTQNVTLSTTGTDGTTVTWSSDKPNVIAANGKVTRPSYTTGDAAVTLTATITKGSATATKTFTLTVTKLAQSDAEAVAAAKPAVEVGYAVADTATSVTQNVTLNTTGTDGTTVTWSSNKPGVIAANGTVTRPSYATGDATVTLTATINKGSASETKTFTLTVLALPFVSTLIQPSQPTESNNKGFEVWINGKAEIAGAVTESKRNEQSVLTITLDQDKLAEKLRVAEQGAVITIPVNDDSVDIIIGQLNGDIISQMKDKQAVLVLQTAQAAYTLPSVEIDIESIAKQLGVTDLQQINVQIEIAKPSAETAKLVKDATADGGFRLVMEPLQFTVRAVNGDHSVEVSQFNAYIERTIAITESVDPNQITTAIVVEADGTTRHVPTKIVQKDGKYYAVVNSLTNSTYALVYHSVQFKDVEGLPAQDAINDLGSRMVVEGSGNGLYEPRKSITRAEFIAIIVRALGLEQNNGASSFTDVKESAWYNGAVNAAYAYHLIDGLGDGQFHPQDVITREQAMVIIARAMTLTKLSDKLSAEPSDTALQVYSDAGIVSTWAEQSIALCLQAGLVNGKSSTLLAPKDYITKAEVAVIIERLLQQSELINK